MGCSSNPTVDEVLNEWLSHKQNDKMKVTSSDVEPEKELSPSRVSEQDDAEGVAEVVPSPADCCKTFQFDIFDTKQDIFERMRLQLERMLI